MKQYLRDSFDNFIKAAMLLLQDIETADAEELVSTGYPFEKSFDAVVDDIITWRNAVLEEDGRPKGEIKKKTVVIAVEVPDDGISADDIAEGLDETLREMGCESFSCEYDTYEDGEDIPDIVKR